LRRRSIEELLEIGFDGYALGGLGIGEPKAELLETLERSDSLIPKDRPRYLMGMGYVEDIVAAVERGVDLFDCVLPTRNARNGSLFTSHGRIVIKNQKYARDFRPLDEACGCPTCRRFSRAYLRHLYERDEISSAVLNTVHNLWFYLDIFRKMRQSMASNSFHEFKNQFSGHIEEGIT
jgi:queuine tRNA-ribosyltransferase